MLSWREYFQLAGVAFLGAMAAIGVWLVVVR